MKNQASSEYVKAWAKLLAEYFAHEPWVITTGKSNSIIIYSAVDASFLLSEDELIEKIQAAEMNISPTGLRMSSKYYKFYLRGTLVKSITVLPSCEFDL